MVVKRLMQMFGVGGPMVRTELTTARAEPGGGYTGMVEVTGGDHPVSVGYIALGLTVGGGAVRSDFGWSHITDGFALAARERRVFEAAFRVPDETPLTHALGQQLAGIDLGLRTELEVAHAVDRTDTDPVQTAPTPAQQRILDALTGLGFQFVGVHLVRGKLRGLPQNLPFYQELEFLPGSAFGTSLHSLKATFVGTDRKLHVVLELDRKVGPLADRDVFGHFTVDPATIADTDWRGLLQDWLQQQTARRGPLF